MIPETGLIGVWEEEKSPPDKTWRIDRENAALDGFTEGLDAVRQAVWLRLSVERGKYPVYSWSYGMVWEDLFGQPAPYLQSELKRRIADTLLQDDRVTAVEDFVFSKAARGKVCVSFTVRTVFGNLRERFEGAMM